MKVLLYQLDGKIPNIALMRIAAHHRERGDDVELRWQGHGRRELWDSGNEAVYASIIFERSRPKAQELLGYWPQATVGGTGWRLESSLESIGIESKRQDYSDYPKWRQSIGFTQRGCRLNCWFCVVPRKEGKVRQESVIDEIWRGPPWPKELLLLDNDFFGQKEWRQRIAEIRAGGFKVSFNQGINCRMINDEAAEAIASIDYRDDSMKVKRLYTAWDNSDDEGPLFRGLDCLKRAGVRPDNIMVYMLIGAGESAADREYRRSQLRDFGCRPYPMPYTRTRELVGFQRWVVTRADLKCSWERYEAAKYRPENVAPPQDQSGGMSYERGE